MHDELHIKMPPQAKKAILELQDKMRLTSTMDLITKAFSLLEMVVDHQKAGGKVILENADESTEVLRPFTAHSPSPTAPLSASQRSVQHPA